MKAGQTGKMRCFSAVTSLKGSIPSTDSLKTVCNRRPGSATTPISEPQPLCDNIRTKWNRKNHLISPNGQFIAYITPIGYLTVLSVGTSRAVWTLPFGKPGAHFTLDLDGFMQYHVEYGGKREQSWQSSTPIPASKMPAVIVLTDKGEIMIMGSDKQPLSWDTIGISSSSLTDPAKLAAALSDPDSDGSNTRDLDEQARLKALADLEAANARKMAARADMSSRWHSWLSDEDEKRNIAMIKENSCKT